MEVTLSRSVSGNTNQRVEPLQNTALFSDLDQEELALVAAASEAVDFAEGSIIFQPGSPAHHLYAIEAGEIVIRSELDSESGREIARFISGEAFGELDMLTSSNRTAYAVAVADSQMLRFPASGRDFRDVLQDNPEVAARILFKLLGTIAGRLRSTNKLISDNTPWVRELRRQVFVDKLTGLANAASLKEQLAAYGRDGEPFTLLMMKPDNFKEINDTYGHEAGDATLKRLAEIFGRAMRGDRSPARYRGNELAALLPREAKSVAEALARELGDTVRELDISDCTAGAAVTVTVSFGIGAFPDDREDIDTLVTDTHALLFAARAAGGDRIMQLEPLP